jgi:F0F1-type ATP synthase membrane subunit a
MVCVTKFRVERRRNVEVFALIKVTAKEIWQKEKTHETETRWQSFWEWSFRLVAKLAYTAVFRKVDDVHYTTLHDTTISVKRSKSVAKL